MGPHAASNDGALDLFCASPPLGLEPDGYGRDDVNVTYRTASFGGVPGSGPLTLSASSPSLCPPTMVLSRRVLSVAGGRNASHGARWQSSIVVTVTDRDMTPELNRGLTNAEDVGDGAAAKALVHVQAVSSRIDEPGDEIPLQQANASLGTFTGLIHVSSSEIPGAENDGIVRLLSGDVLSVFYSPPPYLRPRVPVVEQHLRTWVNASLVLLPAAVGGGPSDVSVVPEGASLTIQVSDADRNIDVSSAGYFGTPTLM
jgi:hypothetical protein